MQISRSSNFQSNKKPAFGRESQAAITPVKLLANEGLLEGWTSRLKNLTVGHLEPQDKFTRAVLENSGGTLRVAVDIYPNRHIPQKISLEDSRVGTETLFVTDTLNREAKPNEFVRAVLGQLRNIHSGKRK